MTSAAAIASLIAPPAQNAAGRGTVEATDQTQGATFDEILNQTQGAVGEQTPQPQLGPTSIALPLQPQSQTSVQTDVPPLVTPVTTQAPASVTAPNTAPTPALETQDTPSNDTVTPQELSADTSALALFAAFISPQPKSTPATPDAVAPRSRALAATADGNGLPAPSANTDTTMVQAIDPTTALPVQDDASTQPMPASIVAQMTGAQTQQAAVQARPDTRQPNPDPNRQSSTDQPQATTALASGNAQTEAAETSHTRGMTEPTANPVQPSASASADTTPASDPLTATTGQTAQATFSVDLKQVSHTPQPTPAPMPVPLDTLAVHIARKVEQGLNQFEITLTPAELGKLDISLRISDDGRVQAVLRAERQETLDLLRQDARTLESQLRQAGLDVNAGALSFHLSQGNPHRYRQDSGAFANSMMQDSAEPARDVTATAWVATRKRDGIDIHV